MQTGRFYAAILEKRTFETGGTRLLACDRDIDLIGTFDLFGSGFARLRFAPRRPAPALISLRFLGLLISCPRNRNNFFMEGSALKQRALEVARSNGIARTRDFENAGVPRIYLSRMRDEGLLVRTARGRYELAGAKATAMHGLAEAARAIPKGVIGLISALHVHGVIAKAPREIWMLLPAKAWAPTSPTFDLRVVRASGAAFSTGIEQHRIDEVAVSVTSLAKTFCDCFKHRAKIGLDQIVDALRIAAEQSALDAETLLTTADVCRVRKVMVPYVRAIL